MQETRLLAKYGIVGYGGRECWKMQTTTVGNVIYVNESDNLMKRIECHIKKWGIDFVGPFKPTIAQTRNRYVIVAMDYYMKWVKVKALQDNTAALTAKFLYEYIWWRFDYPNELISDQGTHFINKVIYKLMIYYAVVHKKSTPYYPQANELEESTNKTL